MNKEIKKLIKLFIAVVIFGAISYTIETIYNTLHNIAQCGYEVVPRVCEIIKPVFSVVVITIICYGIYEIYKIMRE